MGKYCIECGKRLPPRAKFCRSCGARVSPLKAKEVSGTFATLVLLGIIGGILATAGVFLPWISAFGFSVSGWDALSASASDVPYVALLLVGGILALLGGLVAVLVVKVRNIAYLISLGGILAILGWAWTVADAGTLSGWAYGFWACLVGGILSVIGGIAGAVKG
jgi:ribosomal protein L40E